MGLVATNKWTIKLKNMTYIVGGKIDNKAFILVDKVVNDDPRQPVSKLYQSVSNKDIYISLTGDGELMEIIKEYDTKLNLNSDKLEISENFINDIATNFLNNYSDDISKRTSLYIIDKGDFKRIDINFSENEFKDYKIIEFSNNEWIYCNSGKKEVFNSNIQNVNIEGYFDMNIRNLFKVASKLSNTGYTTDEYFINGFDYIEK